MPASARNRKGARHLIGDGLRAKLVGVGLPCTQVLDHKSDNWEGDAPLLMVLTVSADREALYLGPGSLNSMFVFNLTWIVPDQDLAAVPPITSATSDDMLDDIEKLVADWIVDNRGKNDEWEGLRTIKGQPSAVEDFVKGKAYKQESLMLVVRTSLQS